MPRTDATMAYSPDRPRVPDALEGLENGAALCVLASGSSGNCTILAMKRGSVIRVQLIDLGLSPRRTFKLMAEQGLRVDQIDGAIVTHLDHDHFNGAWLKALPAHATLRMHERHASDLESMMWIAGADRLRTFDGDAFDLDEGVHARPLMMSHDDAGASTLRIDMPGLAAGALGFCTDLGHVSSELVDHLRADHGHGAGVDVLAIESNYCPKMQMDSARPWFLKRRIMGGKGHLSNQQALDAVRAVRPREHVVLLHLSRQCNDPQLVADLHCREGDGGPEYALTITSQHQPTRWIGIRRNTRPLASRVVSRSVADTMPLWSLAERASS